MGPSPGPERVTYAGHGGDPVRALFAPGPMAAPGLLLIHEVHGLEAHIEDLAARCAALGYAVLAPELWSREGLPGPDREAVEAPPDRRALADLEAGLAWLAERGAADPRRLAACGFGLGGNLAFQLACTSRRLAAAVDFYGQLVYRRLSANHPIQPLELALNLSCPVLFHFGTEDASIPPQDVARLEATLGPFMKDYELARWEGAGHGFLNDRRRGYHEASARAAWERTVRFLSARLDSRETP